MKFYDARNNTDKLPIKLKEWSYWAYPELYEFEGDSYLIADSGDDIYLTYRETSSENWEVMNKEDYTRFFKKTKEGVICLECMCVLASWHKHDTRICYCENKVTISGGDKKLEVTASNLEYIKYVRINVEI